MTRKDYIRMAAQVRAIRQGEWTDQPPEWADLALHQMPPMDGDELRAVQLAEAYILLCVADNPRFDIPHFLKVCGFAAK